MKHCVATLGADFRTMRLMRNWSQRDMAIKMGVSESTIKNIESGSLGVSIGVYAQAFSIFRRLDTLANALDPLNDPAHARPIVQKRKRAPRRNTRSASTHRSHNEIVD